MKGYKQANPKSTLFSFFFFFYRKFIVRVFLSFTNGARILKPLDFVHPIETEKREKHNQNQTPPV